MGDIRLEIKDGRKLGLRSIRNEKKKIINKSYPIINKKRRLLTWEMGDRCCLRYIRKKVAFLRGRNGRAPIRQVEEHGFFV